jgi:hypothetical protein
LNLDLFLKGEHEEPLSKLVGRILTALTSTGEGDEEEEDDGERLKRPN